MKLIFNRYVISPTSSMFYWSTVVLATLFKCFQSHFRSLASFRLYM